ncbi:MAG: ABC transporter substrate-binding protein [Micropepsaceae bacterium]
MAFWKSAFLVSVALCLAVSPIAAAPAPLPYKETPSLAADVAARKLPPVGLRVPSDAQVVNLQAEGRKPGKSGGVLRMMLSKEKDIRLLSTWGYARLVAWTPQLELKPDVLKSIDVKDGRIFTMHLRAGHKWSDGSAFTTEDFRYYWQDVANNVELSPKGPAVDLLNDGEMPTVAIIDALTVRYSWSKPNARFLPALAQARDPYIYRPAQYLKQFHIKYAKKSELDANVARLKMRSWAQLHNRMDSMGNNDNPDLPTLQPWVSTTSMPASRFTFRRNPYFHRVDQNGVQLPYIDGIEITIVDAGLVTAKTAAGDSDLQARGLAFGDVSVLKANEAKGGYILRTWPIAKGSHFALYPNLNANDAGWRTLMRDARFRHALSLAINRKDLNKALFFGLATEGNNTVLQSSPLFKPQYLTANASFDPKAANALLDAVGVKERNSDGVRLMADKRPLEMIVEIAGESKEEADLLQLVAGHFKAVGIKLVVKPSDRTIMRNRAYSGDAVMTGQSGWDTGIPTPEMSPDELAPTRQDTLTWPKWGNYFETSGKAGAAPDLPEARQLLTLNAQWNGAKSPAERRAIWDKMLTIHSEQQFIIGTVSGVMQPIAVRKSLNNVPERGVFSWDPGAQFGMYRMDEFWFSR